MPFLTFEGICTMEEIQVRRNWWILAMIGWVFTFSISNLYKVTVTLYINWRSIHPSSDTSTLVLMAFYHAGIIGLNCFLGQICWIELLTRFSEDGISRPRWGGYKLYRWADVIFFRRHRASRLHLKGADWSLNLNGNFYCCFDDLVGEIRKRIPWQASVQVKEASPSARDVKSSKGGRP